MNWENIPHRGLIGGYIEVLNEGLPSMPNQPEAAIKRHLRGKIRLVSWLRKLPTFRIANVKKFDSRLDRWKVFRKRSTLTLRLADFERKSGLLRPVNLKRGRLLLHTLNGVSAVIYPNGVKPPKRPFLGRGQDEEIIDLIHPRRS